MVQVLEEINKMKLLSVGYHKDVTFKSKLTPLIVSSIHNEHNFDR